MLKPFLTILFAILCLTPLAYGEIRVGVILPLTGSSADYGVAIKNSILLAKEDHPEMFSNISFIFEDTFGNDPRRAVDAFHKLSSSNVSMIYSWGVALCKAIAPLAESKQIPFIGQCIAREIGKDRKYVMRFMPDSRKFMKVQADYLAQSGVRKIALLISEHSYTEELMKSLEENLPTSITIVRKDTIPQGEMDLRPYITRLQKESVDYIGNLLFVGQVSQFYKQSHSLKVNIKSFGNNLFESDSELISAAGTMNGSVFSNTKIYPSYIERYNSRYGDQNQLSFGSLAYEFAISTAKLFRDDKDLDGSEIMKRWQSLPSSNGVASGPYEVKYESEIGWYVDFPIVMKTIKNGSVVNLN